MIFPQCQSSSHDTTRFDGTKIVINCELKIMHDELFYGDM